MSTRGDGRVREYGAFPLFAGCSREQLREVSRVATRLSPGAGRMLVGQGERRHQFVIVLGGTAEVWRDGLPIDEIGAGSYFGEIALISRIREPASIVARTAMTVDVIAQREFATLYADLALIRQRLDQELDRRLAKWISVADARAPQSAAALPHLASQPLGRVRSWGGGVGRLVRAELRGGRPRAVPRCRRASR